MIGGKVRGGQILGKFQDSMLEGNDVDVGRGRVLPTTPWEAVWNGVSEWFGVEDPAERAKILPHSVNFPAETLFSKAELFE